MSRLYHLTSWHGNKKSEQCHVKQNCNLYRLVLTSHFSMIIFHRRECRIRIRFRKSIPFA
ncbi:hypothetical protein FVE68_14465 [Geobacillus sp. AYS3]|nr:hypothetical protein DCC82_10945 [Geobacillus sp. LYN3]TXK86450.1 hypothetical protein FVE68_14465 [Geobacillus sp. AYS3]